MNKIKKIFYASVILTLTLISVVVFKNVNRTELLAVNNKNNEIKAYTYSFTNHASISSEIEIGSTQKPKDNIFCFQENKEVYSGTYKKGSFNQYSIDNKDYYKIGYILQAKDSSGTYYRSQAQIPDRFSGPGIDDTFNIAQEAIWATREMSGTYESEYGDGHGGKLYFNYRKVNMVGRSVLSWAGGPRSGNINYNTPPKFVILYRDACNYSTDVKNLSISIDSSGSSQSYNSEGDIVLGPYKLTSTQILGENPTIEFDVSGTDGISITNKSGNSFYIKISKNKISTNSGANINIKALIKDIYYCKGDFIWKRTGAYETDEQQLKGFIVGTTTVTKTANITVPILLPELEIQLNGNGSDGKVNDYGNPIINETTKFKVEFTQNGKPLKTVTGVGINGTATSGQPKSKDNITVKITEQDPPEGYTNIVSEELQAVYSYENSGWKLVQVKGNLNAISTDTGSKTKTVSHLQIINKRIIQNLVIKKVNIGRTGLQGAKFKVTIDNGKILSNISIFTTDSNGNISLGQVKIDNLKEPLIVTLAEIEAPTGYYIKDKTNGDKFVVEINCGSDNKWSGAITERPTYLQESIYDELCEVKINGRDEVVENETVTVNVMIPNLLIPKLTVKIDGDGDNGKVNDYGNAISNNTTTFDVKFIQNGTELNTVRGVKIGGIATSIQPIRTNNITVSITENNPPEGYANLNPATVTAEYRFNGSSWEFVKSNNEQLRNITVDTRSKTETVAHIQIINKRIIQDLVIKKVNTEGTGLQGAKFKVTIQNGTILSGESIFTTEENGNISLGQVRIDNLKEPLIVTLAEIEAPTGYYIKDKTNGDKFVVEINCDSDNKWSGAITQRPTHLQDSMYDELCKVEINERDEVVENETVIVNVMIPNLSQIDKVRLIKTNQNDRVVSGAKFKVTDITNCINAEDIKSKTYTTDSHGILEIGPIVSEKIQNAIEMTLEETSAPTGYQKVSGKIIVTYTYNKETDKWECAEDINTVKNEDEETKYLINNGYTNELENIMENETKIKISDSDGLTIQVKDLYKIERFYINKKSTANATNSKGEKSKNLEGATFEFTINSNAYFITEDRESDEMKNISPTARGTTDRDGRITNLPPIVILNGKTDTKITVKEIGVPLGHLKLEEFELTIKRNEEAKKYTVTYNDGTGVTSASSTENTITINLENTAIMNIGGRVWVDEFDGQYKEGAKRNGIYDSNEGFGGIKVYLYNNNNNTEYVAETTTDEKGNYVFEKVPVKSGYVVVFEYNGIKYITVADKTDNDAEELNRSDYNKYFEEISAEGANGGKTNLKYKYSTNKAELSETDPIQYIDQYGYDGNRTDNIASIFAEASVPIENWEETWGTWIIEDDPNTKDIIEEAGTGTPAKVGTTSAMSVDCGLQERIFDLSLGLDVKDAEVSINEKTTTYTYDEILNMSKTGDFKLDRFKIGETNSKDAPKSYNLNIFNSDYNYRIKDYTSNKVPYGNEDSESREGLGGNELDVSVTYKMLLTNQSVLDEENGDAYATEIKTDFDQDIYSYRGIKVSSSKGGTISPDKVEVKDDEDGNKIITLKPDDKTNLKLDSENIDNSNTITLEITFDVNKDEKGALKLYDEDESQVVAEITKYETANGFIDIDSAPGDYEEHGYQDDTDEAKVLEITTSSDIKRKISGIAFDADKLAKATSENEKSEANVNDVIVQLVELKKLGTNTYEYIWQETRSGSGTVYVMNNEGTAIEEKTEMYDGTNKGYYEFEDFIPGNYIVRFIYGDGRTYTLNAGNYEVDEEGKLKTKYLDSLDNVKEYNGQDYKSTKFVYYKGDYWHNTLVAEGKTGNDKSVARDNEARRLGVMSYSVDVNNERGTEIKNKTNDMLDATWMCAETLNINVPVGDKDETNPKEIGISTETPQKGEPRETITFTNVNLGLEKRPETKLELQKHITALRVNTVDGQILVDATLNKDTGKLEGVTKNLSTIESARDNRGFWKLETDLSELAQGSEMEVTYEYTVENVGYKDYLSEELVTKYTNMDIEAYATYLEGLEGDRKAKMYTEPRGTLLGQYYYTNLKGSTDEEVPTQPIEVQEALNNKLAVGELLDFNEVEKERDSYKFTVPEESEGNKKRPIWRDTGSKIDLKLEDMKTLVITKEVFDKFVAPNRDEEGKIAEGDRKISSPKSITLKSTITTDGGSFDSYLAEITRYTNAAGRATVAVPQNLTYAHSDDTARTLDTVPGNYDEPNEYDEFWGESVVISKPTGEDKLTTIQIVLISTASAAILAAGIVLIKKFVIKK